MTARVITLKGVNAGVYYTEQLPSYYLDAGEPRGLWFGDAAASLGLRGVVDDAAFVNVIGGLDPTGAYVLGRRHGEESVRGFDVTFSAPKSVSVLWGLGDETRAPKCSRRMTRRWPPRWVGSNATPPRGYVSTAKCVWWTPTGSPPRCSVSTPHGRATRSCIPTP